MKENDISKIVLDASIRIHKETGPGLLESVYETLLCFELMSSGLNIRRQVAVPLVYRGINMDLAFRMDILVEEKVIVEVKSVEEISKVHFKQVLTYLKLADMKLGLLINFNDDLVKDGFYRVVNGL